jgi:hypothetical protein
MSVDNLPARSPRREVDFSTALIPFVRDFFRADLSHGVESLPKALQRAVVVAGGKLGPAHTGLARFLPTAG